MNNAEAAPKRAICTIGFKLCMDAHIFNFSIFTINLCLFTFYFTFSSDSYFEPVQIIPDKIHDEQNWWYLEYRVKLHNSENSFIPSSQDECENLLLNGHWHKPSFKISGIIFEDQFGRKLSCNFSSYHENNCCHIYNHPFKSKTKDDEALRLYTVG